MVGIILAAGIAARLKPLTDNTPKCLLKVNDREILFYALDNLKKNNIRKVIIVTGFLKEKIEEFVEREFPRMDVTFIYNKDYANTNNAFSLLLTNEYVKEDFILMDSDIIFSPRIIPLLLNNNNGVQLAIKKHDLSEEEIKVIMNEDNRISSIGKWVEIERAYGESIGIEYFPENSGRLLFEKLQKRVVNEKRINEFYEFSFQEMIEDGADYYGVDINDLDAIEIDYSEDLKNAEKIINDKKIFSRV
ncbi:MAG: phosphocholine cytidylyltransferase family protein [Spirochaetes bacterium]|nr:phosphocholine cytidylyltransferase family protein [Spirochaetota bacterium]